MNRKFRNYKEHLFDGLQDPQEALAYLNAALEDEDQRVFLLALKDVLEARNDNLTELAEEAKLNRQNLYRILSERGNPKLTSLKSLFDVLGLQIQLSFKDKNSQ